MQRYALEQLIAWKNKENHKPLVIQGARQVGKTWLMQEFGKKYYRQVAYINFDIDAKSKEIFDTDYKLLGLGFTDDPEADIAKLREKMEAAGAQKVYDEIQKQALEFIAAN